VELLRSRKYWKVKTMRDLPELAVVQNNHRRWLVGAAVGSAALAAAGAFWWRSRRGAEVSVPLDPELAAFWATSWVDPQGKALNVQQFQGKPLLINFWATWCPPCVEELPLINAFFQQNKSNGWQVLGLAVDRVDMVQKFLRQNPVDFPVAMAGLGGSELGRALGNLSGGLPFTVVVGGNGAIAQRKLGRVTPENLHQWAGLK
jgi:thiol-disulfide isomerase/thioredoxin